MNSTLDKQGHWRSFLAALVGIAFLVGVVSGCGSDSSSTDRASSGGSGGAVVNIACPPGVPIVAQGVGGGTGPGSVCSNGTGTAKLGERCLSNANCTPGTFCFSDQCTAICGDSQRKLGQYSSMAPCQELFGFAVCVVATKATGVQASIPQSVFFCAPTCANASDCSVGATCTQGEYYKSLPTDPPSYEWYDLALVCTVDQ